MQISRLHIDDFGGLTSVDLPHLATGLNVVWGAQGDGKTTLRRFVRSMVFDGQGDRPSWEAATGKRHSVGTLHTAGAPGHFAVQRWLEDAQRIGVTVRDSDNQAADFHDLPYATTPNIDVFDTVFAFSFRDRPPLQRLLNCATHEGIAWEPARPDASRWTDLERCCAARRRELDDLGPGDRPRSELEQEQRTLEQDIHDLSHTHPDREQWGRERYDGPAHIRELESRLAELRTASKQLHSAIIAISSHHQPARPETPMWEKLDRDRDHLQARHRELQTTVDQTERELQAAHARNVEYRVDLPDGDEESLANKRQRLQVIDRQIAAADKRDRLIREVDALEEQIRALRGKTQVALQIAMGPRVI